MTYFRWCLLLVWSQGLCTTAAPAEELTPESFRTCEVYCCLALLSASSNVRSFSWLRHFRSQIYSRSRRIRRLCAERERERGFKFIVTLNLEQQFYDPPPSPIFSLFSGVVGEMENILGSDQRDQGVDNFANKDFFFKKPSQSLTFSQINSKVIIDLRREGGGLISAGMLHFRVAGISRYPIYSTKMAAIKI